MDMTFRCRSCGHTGTRACPGEMAPGESCRSYLSWSEHWTQEMVSIERALHSTYLLAACFVVLAAATVLLPGAFS